MLIQAFRGFCMALADSVPGVSGGTVAFILGFYEEFVGSLHALCGRDAVKRRQALRFLVRLGIGWGFGMGLAATVLAQVFDSGVYVLSSAFIGLTLAAIPFVVRAEWKTVSAKPHCGFALLGIGVVLGLGQLPHTALDLAALPRGNLYICSLSVHSPSPRWCCRAFPAQRCCSFSVRICRSSPP